MVLACSDRRPTNIMGPIIPGRNIETVKEMVNYIYKGKLEDINTHTFIKIFTSTKVNKERKSVIIKIHDHNKTTQSAKTRSNSNKKP